MILASTFATDDTILNTQDVNPKPTAKSLFTNALQTPQSRRSGDLVLALKLDETSGRKAFDSSPYGQNNDGRLSKDATFQFFGGDLNGGVTFDGRNDVISIKNSPDINKSIHAKRTISIWFNANDVDITDQKQVIYEEGGGNRGLNIYLDNGQLYVGGWNRPKSQWTGSFLSTDDVISENWHNVTLVLDAKPDRRQTQPNVFSAYLDGEKFGAAEGSQLWSHGGGIGVGRIKGKTRFHDGISTELNGFAGSIADVKIYNQSLNSEKIKALSSLTKPIKLITRTLDGSQNNPLNAELGQVGSLYSRVGEPTYADGLSESLTGPDPRYISNRIFQDLGQNFFL